MRTILLSAVVLAGCAFEPRTADERGGREYRREVTRIEEGERLERLKRTCRQSGGVVHIGTGGGLARRGSLEAKDMKHATCVIRR